MLLKQLMLLENYPAGDDEARRLFAKLPGKPGLRGVKYLDPDHVFDFLEEYRDYLRRTKQLDAGEEGEEYDVNQFRARDIDKVIKTLRTTLDSHTSRRRPREGRKWAFASTDDFQDCAKQFRQKIEEIIGNEKFTHGVLYVYDQYDNVNVIATIPNWVYGAGYTDWEKIGDDYVFYLTIIEE